MTHIIKGGAQFQKVASLDTMNDACSYKLWVKDKYESEIAALSDYLWKLEEIAEDKSNEMVNLVTDNSYKEQQKKHYLENEGEIRKNLTKANWKGLISKNNLKKT